MVIDKKNIINYLFIFLISTALSDFFMQNVHIAIAFPLKQYLFVAIPPWAYAEKQKASPIKLKGEIQSSNCTGGKCLLSLKTTELIWNKTKSSISIGEIIQIEYINSTQTNIDSPPVIGSENYINLDFKKGQSVFVWIKPSIDNNDVFIPASGPSSFGPDLSSELK